MKVYIYIFIYLFCFIVSGNFTTEEFKIISCFLEKFDTLKQQDDDNLKKKEIKSIISLTDFPDIDEIIYNHGIAKLFNNVTSLPYLKTLNLDCIYNTIIIITII